MNNVLIKYNKALKNKLKKKRKILSHKKIQNILNKNIGIIVLRKKKNMNGS